MWLSNSFSGGFINPVKRLIGGLETRTNEIWQRLFGTSLLFQHLLLLPYSLGFGFGLLKLVILKNIEKST